MENILSFEKVSFSYNKTSILHDFSISFQKGISSALIGESGSGKTTLARLALGVIEGYQGIISFQGKSLIEWMKGDEIEFRKRIQYVFQDPNSSLNPKRTMRYHLNEVLQLHFPTLSKEERLDRIKAILPEFSLSLELLDRYSFELSGGQKQRFVLARALLIQPELLILDEPLAALDISLRYTIISFLQKFQKNNNTTYIYITHDMASLKDICDQLFVLYKGVLVEEGPVAQIMHNPIHPYTQKLIQATLFTK